MAQEPIAIIGIGCRFPGEANTPLRFWQILRNGVDTIQEIPPDRWNQRTYYHPDPVEPGKTYARWGGFIPQIDAFDAKFFGINRQEAARLDPQHRHLLEVTWEALADAGIPPEQVAGTNTGVFVGMSFHDYPDLQFSPSECETLNAYSIMGAGSGASSRVAYWFDLHGPSMCVDTACSSSLTATHLACQSIWRGESEMALAAGVNLILKPEITVAMSKAFLLSAEGSCKSFDAAADGYVRGEGTGVVVLKPLAQALKDNDRIYAVIRATVINQDGHKSSLAAPSGVAQEQALRRAYQQAEVDPRQIQYVETQGTGTQVGDPIEANAIGSVVGANREDDCWIGSVKTNLGHLEGAAGIASLIKTTLALYHGQIPPNLHFNTPNPKIDFERLHLGVPTRLEAWRPGRWLAGVNSFGVGGTNAHVVLESITPYLVDVSPPLDHQAMYLLPLSAKTSAALRQWVQAWLDYLSGDGAAISLHDMCYTASVRRGHHLEQRIVFMVHSKLELQEQLTQFLHDPVHFAAEAAKLPASDTPEVAHLRVLGQSYQQGQAVMWASLYPQAGQVVSLPPYPWQHQRYWHESDLSRTSRLGQAGGNATVMVEQVGQVLQTKISQLDLTGLDTILNAPRLERAAHLQSYIQKQLAHLVEQAARSLTQPFEMATELEQPQKSQEKYEFLEQLKMAPIYERRDLLTQHLCAQVAEVMGLDFPESLNLEQGFFDMGMNSLQAINLQNSLKRSLGYSLPATLAFKYPTIQALVNYLIDTALPIEFVQPITPVEFKLESQNSTLDQLLHDINDEEILLNMLLTSLNEIKPVNW